METQYWFKSEKFIIEKGEDEETNPLCYGKSLATWLSQKLAEFGYQTDVIPEDWGWCVVCERSDYFLWLACGCMTSDEMKENYSPDDPPAGSEVVWHVFPVVEVPFLNFLALFKKWTGKLDMRTPVEKLNSHLVAIFNSESEIVLCDEPQA